MKIFFLEIVAAIANSREANRALFRALRERDRRNSRKLRMKQQRMSISNYYNK